MDVQAAKCLDCPYHERKRDNDFQSFDKVKKIIGSNFPPFEFDLMVERCGMAGKINQDIESIKANDE